MTADMIEVDQLPPGRVPPKMTVVRRPCPPLPVRTPAAPITMTRTSHLRANGQRTKGDTPLARVIELRGFLATEVSRITGISQRQLTELTSGRQQPHVKQVIALCKCLDVEPGDIFPPPSSD